MKKFKKIASLLLALVMVCAMSVTAFAADATITVENSVTGKTYEAYKIFDATSSGSAVSYTIDSTSNPWYSVISNSGLFTLTQAGSTTTYYVTQTGTNEAVIALIKDNYKTVSDSEATTGTGNGGNLVLNVKDAGYYYVTTTTGSVITVDTAADTVTVVDKNQTPGGDLKKEVSDTEAQIGDTVTYTITSSVPAYDEETEIDKYTFTDVLSNGLTAPVASAVSVKIMDASGYVYAYLTSDTDVTFVNEDETTTTTKAVSVDGQTITITFNPTNLTKASVANEGDTLSSLDSYPADATIKIVYTATVNTLAVYENGNTVTQTWTGDSTGTNKTEKVYTYGFYLQKVDSKDTSTVLSGAEFHLTDGTDTLYFVYNSTTDTYSVVPADTQGASTVITVGEATIFGLDADKTYYLYEDKAPAGYNLISGVAATITVGQTVEGVAQYDTNGINTTISQVQNSAGSSLPSTGGIGTTIFYVVGTIMVLGAVVVLITRKRMSAQ